MHVYKMLCLNRFREYKRLINNMLLPVLSLAFIAGFIGYQMIVLFFPVLLRVKNFNIRAWYGLISILAVYSGYCCFIKIKPVITVKPASIFFLSESRLNRLVHIKFMGEFLKHFILAFFLAVCINGIKFDRMFCLTIISVFGVLNAGCLLRWKVYHRGKRTWQDVGVWSLLCFPAMLLNICPYVVILTAGVWFWTAWYDLFVLKLNIVKYEDEMQFAEKVLVAQNYNNTVLLTQYAKEKKVRYLSKREKVSKLLLRAPLVWKARISIYRLSKDFIIAGIVLFVFGLSIYKIPFFWSMPFLEQKEIRYFLLIGSIFVVFQLTLQSMVRQLDSILEKAQEGLFIPVPQKQIIKQFAAIPVMVIGGESLVLAFIMQSNIFHLLIGCVLSMLITILVFWLDVKYKGLLSKVHFVLSVAIFIITLVISG